MIYGSRASAARRRRLCALAALLSAVLGLGAQEGGPGSSLRRAASGPYGSPPEPASSWERAVPEGLGPEGSALPAPGGSLSLGLEEAVEIALERNLGLAAERIGVESKRRASELAWNAFLPTVDTSLTLNRWNVEKTLGPATLPRWGLSASLQANLVLNAALFEGIRSLRLDYEAGLISYAQARARLELDVRKGFYNLLLLRENMALMAQNIEAAERRYQQASANYRSGLAPELTMLQAQVAWENLKPELEGMKVGYESALAAFGMSLGLPREVRAEPAGLIEPAYRALSADELVSSRLGERLDVQAILKSLAQLRTRERALRQRLLTPSLALGWSLDPSLQDGDIEDLPGDPFKDPLFGEGAWKQSSGMFRLTLTMSLNALLPSSKEAQGLLELREAQEAARAGLAQALRGAELEIDALVLRLEKSRTSTAALELNVDLAERAYRLAEVAYRAGAKDLLDVQAAELELQRARLGLLAEDFAYVTGLLDLEHALGLPFGSLSKEGNR